ncbi:nuclear membrane fusion kar5 [Fusarium albosuccineum]|uniref:Nuclear membrane fusion kar5 n=1 Tax=Fusarium albosuccineum TaxID=1237068 RepID=A0A8H4L5S2_9HYPO|nr:nuclear membrane fusion kar5 [Fusarium albosuccineum]
MESAKAHARATGSPLQHQQPGPRLTNVYTSALEELQELESEPLCHRIAARLLINNCHLLDGQDEATIHIDSGRAARDFVDSYAASLAICDLERGSFVIPSTCFKFRESALAALPVPATPQLHVSTTEIDNCLEGLAHSDSAWNTWVSYRHKALRFCEASRADHEKGWSHPTKENMHSRTNLAENLHLYQRVTKILEKLTHEIETEMEERLQSLNQAFQSASHSVENLGPQVHKLRMELELTTDALREQLNQAVQESSNTVRSGLEDARSLHQLIDLLIRTTKENAAAVISSHETSMKMVSKNANSEIDIFMTALTAAVASSVSLQSQMETTESRNAGILQKQAKIEMGMGKLEELADSLLVKYDIHESRLDQAQQKTDQILEILDATATSAAGFQNYIIGGFSFVGFWPYVVFPALSLTMGSYGLQPSLWRNLWLVAIGELAGLVVSNADRYTNIFLFSSTVEFPDSTFNGTDRLPNDIISII